jgi:hypothetical protein
VVRVKGLHRTDRTKDHCCFIAEKQFHTQLEYDSYVLNLTDRGGCMPIFSSTGEIARNGWHSNLYKSLDLLTKACFEVGQFRNGLGVWV